VHGTSLARQARGAPLPMRKPCARYQGLADRSRRSRAAKLLDVGGKSFDGHLVTTRQEGFKRGLVSPCGELVLACDLAGGP
jgi:hypothetical protein